MLKTLKYLLVILMISFLAVPQGYSMSMPLTPEYLGFIQQKINSYFIYPQEALTNGWEGIAKVRFTMAQDGRVKDIDIAESSGYPLLDAAAILAVKDASPYPFPGNNLEEREIEITLPVSFEQPRILRRKPAQMAYSMSAQESSIPAGEAKQGLSQMSYQAPFIPSESKGDTEKKGGQELPRGSEKTEISTPAPQPTIESSPEKTTPPQIPSLTPTQELPYFIELALQNNQPTKVAREEVEFAQLKVTEAQRNLFPALKVMTYNTNGEVFKVGYTERETKVQIDQPLFYGGRLIDSLKQAKTNLEITQKNYDRLKLDVVQKAETAYYNLVAAKMNFAQKESLLQEAKDMLKKIEALSTTGMIIPVEASSAAAWFEQLQFQQDSIKQDLFMAELTFKQVLNVKETPKVETQLLEAKKLNLNLEHCLELAYRYRPEIYLSELLVKFNNYGQKVESSKNNAFTVDLTSSYGSYEGAFKTESMRHSDNWYLGLKVSKPWGANTFNGSYTEEHSQPRFGQTSPTESSTFSGEFNLLDNIRRLSDKKRSDIDLHRSISDFDETLKTVTFEVQDAFLNYQKAVLQLNTAEVDIKFRRSQTEVTKVRAMAGETNLSVAMEALYSLSEAQTRYTQALANYQISLANLKKATGYGLRI